MGKASKWLRSLLTGKKEKAEASLPPPSPTQLPVAKEKKRWRFRRPTVAGRSMISTLGGEQPPEAESARRRQAIAVVAATAAAAEAAFAAAQAVAAVVRLTAGSSHQKAEEIASTRIQSAFRGYLVLLFHSAICFVFNHKIHAIICLSGFMERNIHKFSISSLQARKALCALRGLVKLQALVRGHLIRKQAAAAAAARCCMQALLITAQERAQSHRIQSFHRRSSPQNPRSRHNSHASPIRALDRNAEDIKVVEMDLGASRGSTKSRNSYSLTQSSSGYCVHAAATPSKGDDQSPEFSPCDRAQSEHLEDFAFAKSQSSPLYLSSISVPDATPPNYDCHFFVPSYMADTESSRAKARSQSAPRQRTDAIGRRQTSRRRLSVEGRKEQSWKREDAEGRKEQSWKREDGIIPPRLN